MGRGASPFPQTPLEDVGISASTPAGVEARAYDLVLNGKRDRRRLDPNPPARGAGKGLCRLVPSVGRKTSAEVLVLPRMRSNGPPPHGGIAFGLIAVDAFTGAGLRCAMSSPPKTQHGTDPSDCPTEVPRQLEELFIRPAQRLAIPASHTPSGAPETARETTSKSRSAEQLAGARVGRLMHRGAGTAGFDPRKSAARMPVRRDEQVGTIGGGRVEKEVVDAARYCSPTRIPLSRAFTATTLTRQLGMRTAAAMEVFVEPLCLLNLIVCGGGHVAQALILVGSGFCPIVIEDLEGARQPERLPEGRADHRQLRRQRLARGAARPAQLCRDRHPRSLPAGSGAADTLLPHDSAYLGLIGSQRKDPDVPPAPAEQRLRGKGAGARPCSDRAAHRAQTPPGDRHAIAAELIAVRGAARREEKSRSEARASGSGAPCRADGARRSRQLR